MFKKPPSLGTTTVLKNSDRRNLVKELVERYASNAPSATISSNDSSRIGDATAVITSGLTTEECKEKIFPEGLKQCKATTSAGDHCTVFFGGENGNPVAFRIGKGDQGPLIPTGMR